MILFYVPDLRFDNDEWESEKIDHSFTLLKGNGLSKSDLSLDGNPCILYGHLYTTYLSEIIEDVIYYTSSDLKNPVLSISNDIIIPASGETPEDIATACCVIKDGIILGGDLNILRTSQHDGAFTSYQLNGKRKYDIAKLAVGKSIVHLHNEDIKSLTLYFPTNINTEKKIADFLLQIDRRISTQKKIIEDLQAQKKSIINKIYTDTLCNCKLSEIITQVSIRNKNDDIDNVLSVSNKYGFIKQSDQFEDREVASDDVTNYKIVEKDIFAYNPARINVGSIAKYDLCEKGIISPMYICFKANGRLCPEYLNYYFLSSIFKRQMAKRLEGSVRQCLTYESLANIPFYLPSLEIQKKNATVIAAFISKINLENNYLKLLGNQKAYLLNKMFI